MPANVERMSERVGFFSRYSARGVQDELDLLLRRHGLEPAAAIGVSVVPTSVCPCHGIANITRPSLVCGTMIAAVARQE